VQRPHHRLTLLLALILALGLACSDGGPEEYSEATRQAFMEGCVEDDSDADLVEVCECTYDTAAAELPYERFHSMERRLQQGATDIPDEISEIILDCIRSVSASRS
jgi:hypothetical protein